MTMRDDNGRRVASRDDGFGWRIPAVIAAILIIGGLFYIFSDTRVTTASNNRPAVTQNDPVRTPTTTPAPAPAPAPAPTR